MHPTSALAAVSSAPNPPSLAQRVPSMLLVLGLAILARASLAEDGSASASEVTLAQADRAAVAAEPVSSRRASGAGFADQARFDFQLVSGPLFFPVGIGPDDESFRTFPIDLRLGWWMTPPLGSGWLRGRFEGIFEVSVAPVFEGAGSIVVGPSLLWRYNFVQPGASLVPYFQIGAGVVYNDAYQDRTQQAIGRAVEFSLQASVGTRFFLSSRVSLDAELQYHHISNAGLARRNQGVNALGGLIGFSYFWDAR